MMQNLKQRLRIIFILLILFFSQYYSQTLTLNESIETALSNNRDIKIAKLDVEKAEEAVDEAFGYALPSFDLSANFSHFLSKPKMAFPDFEALLTNATYNILFNEGVLPQDNSKFLPMESKLQSFSQTNNFEASAQVTQILFNSAVFRGIGASQIYLDLSKEQLKAKTAEVVFNVKQAFYGALLTKQMLDITKATLANTEENLKNVKSYFEQGLTSEFEMMQAEVMVENIRPKVYELENLYKDTLNKLKLVIGVDQNSELNVTGEINYTNKEIPEIDDALSIALSKNYDISSLKVKKQIDEEFIALDRSEYWPQLAAFGNYTYAGSSDSWNFQNYSATTVGLSFSMNIFNGGRTQNKVDQSLIGLRQTEEQINTLKDYTVSEVKNTINNLHRVKLQVDAVERNVNLAERAYEISVTRYNEGTGTQLEIKNANIELQTAKTNRLQVVHDYIIAFAKLDKLLGILSETEIDFIKN
jgi:outer membrane protein TolC